MGKYFTPMSALLIVLGIISIFYGNNIIMFILLCFTGAYLFYKIKGIVFAFGFIFYGLFLLIGFGIVGLIIGFVISYILLISKDQNA